jgi:RNA polymerase sigma-70 factor (ECF subfamily)
MLPDTSEAADVTQEVFLKAFRGLAGFRQGSSLKTWLYRIAVRQALNHRRWLGRHLRHQSSIDSWIGESGRPAVVEFQAPGASPFEEVANRELQQTVRQALGQVPENFRAAVVLRDLEGLSYEEIAEVLDVSVGTVKSRILRGRCALRKLLEPVFASGRVVP